jgi:hypothetical protein
MFLITIVPIHKLAMTGWNVEWQQVSERMSIGCYRERRDGQRETERERERVRGEKRRRETRAEEESEHA